MLRLIGILLLVGIGACIEEIYNSSDVIINDSINLTPTTPDDKVSSGIQDLPDSIKRKMYKNIIEKGNKQFDMKNYSRALGNYTDAAQLLPDEIEAWYNQGCAYYELGEYCDAFPVMEKVLDMQWNYGDAKNIWYHAKQKCSGNS